jgi:hypothetical protein
MAGHSHSCGQEHHEHDHDDAERGREFSLYLKIDTDNVQCLNESVEGSGKHVFKPWENKLDTEKVRPLSATHRRSSWLLRMRLECYFKITTCF